MHDDTGDNDTGDNRPPCYYEIDDSGKEWLIIRASAIGSSCLYELVAAGQDHDPSPIPATLRGAFNEGHALEPLVLAQLEARHGVTLDHQAAQREGHLELFGGVRVRFHPDGRGFYTVGSGVGMRTTAVIVEVKALADQTWQQAVRHGVESTIDEYQWQASVMMHATHLPLLWAVYNKGGPRDEEGRRTPTPDQGKIHLQLVTKPFVTLSEIALKAQHIKELVDGEDVLDTGMACSDPSHYPCRYQHLRPQGESEGTQVSKPGNTHAHIAPGDCDRVNSLIRQYVYSKGQADEHRQRADQARDEIIALLGGDSGKVETDKWIVPVVNGRGNKSLAWSEMTAEDKAIVESYQRPGKPYKYIKGIKRKDMEDDAD